jgi:hypothetical protein
MRFEVKKGIVKHRGAFHLKGSFFDAEKSQVKGLINSGAIAPVEPEPLDSDDGTGEGELLEVRIPQFPNPQPDMTIEDIKKFLEHAEIEKVESLLQAELAKPEPRKTAVKLLQEWLKDTVVQPPSLNVDDVIEK